MITLLAGAPAPTLSKAPAAYAEVLLDLQDLLTLPHEAAVRIVGLDTAGADVRKSRCNGGRYVQLDFGPDSIVAPVRTLTIDVLTTERTLRTTLRMQTC